MDRVWSGRELIWIRKVSAVSPPLVSSAPIDITDVPAVSGADLERLMRHLIGTGRGLALVKGLSDDEWSEIDDLIWSYDWAPARRVAVALRLRALVAAFTARRLKALLMQRGFAVLGAAMAAAAGQRLNVRFGFTVQTLLSDMSAALTKESVIATPPLRLPLAAAA